MGKLAGQYCAVGKDCTGVERFVVGDYTWTMEEALMIGDVRDGLKIELDLRKVLFDGARHEKLCSPEDLELGAGTGCDVEHGFGDDTS